MKIAVVAHPNSKNPRVEIDLLGTYHVYVSQPPLENKANKAVVEALVQFFNTKKRNVTFVTGTKSKNKIFEIF